MKLNIISSTDVCVHAHTCICVHLHVCVCIHRVLAQANGVNVRAVIQGCQFLPVSNNYAVAGM